MKAIHIITFFLFSVSLMKCQVKKESVKKTNYINDSITVVKVGEAALLAKFGEKTFLEYRPYIANLLDQNTWIIEGTLGAATKGGVPTVEINRFDRKILDIYIDR